MILYEYIFTHVCGDFLVKIICTYADVVWHSSITECLGLAALSSVICNETDSLQNGKRLLN